MEQDHEHLVKEIDGASFDDDSQSNSVGSEKSQTEVDCIHFDTCDDTITYTESLEVDVIYSAPPLKDLYKYHIFFSHSNEDKSWVSAITQRLESEPYNYKCYYEDSVMETKENLLQTALCAAMLSERVVVVLSQSYVKHKWMEFQQQLQNLTEFSLYRQRMLVVLLKDCVIPDSLQPMGFLDARESDFFPCFVRHLRSDRLPRSSESFSSEMTCMLYNPTNIENGQLLTSLSFAIKGRWEAKLQCVCDDDVPTPLCCHGINMSYSNFMDIIRRMENVTSKEQRMVSILFSLRPTVILGIAVVIWLSAFVFVVVYLMDETKQGALGARLVVFSIPLLFVLYGYVTRWQRQQFRQKICKRMLRECVHINEELAVSEKPLLLTTTMTKSGIFYIHFIYFCVMDCVTDVDMLLVNYLDEDLLKFEKLIEVYTGAYDYLQQCALSERLTVMVSTIYLHRMLMNQLPSYPQQRHTSHKFCLCQFVEQLVTDFFQCLSKKSIVYDLQRVLMDRLNFHLTIQDIKKYQNALAIQDEFSFNSV